ncbi:MAG: isocitrate/isopropylmalate dehydrogenase family protein [Phycisphaerales bacterium]|nr:isocitrate/isopropylmalate dehydrogenase family protein [Phycisphaerales bacterium]
MPKYHIAWMPGDGVGHDVMDAAKIVLDALHFDARYTHADIGWEFWCREGDPLPRRTIDILKNTDCALFGAITSKPREEAEAELDPSLHGKGLVYFSPIVKLRQLFNLHTNLRPCKAYPGNPLNYRDDIDQVVFRENTEGMYGGVEFFPLPESVYQALCLNPKMKPWKDKGLENVALSTRIMSRQGCESICRQAFEYAKTHGRKSVTLVEKPNVLRETGGLMTRIFREVARDYPGIAAWEANIDAICMWMIKNPQDYDVLVAENMFGDIISDLCAGLVGGLGFASAANIGDNYAVFEPTHGSAPKYAGRYVVNPMAMLLTVKLMFDWLGEADLANRLESAVAKVIRDGKVATYDVRKVKAGDAAADSTLEVAEEVARNL